LSRQASSNLCLSLRDRWIWQVQKRRLDQRRHDENIHRHIARKTCVTYFLCNSKPAVDLHCAGVAPFHLGEELRRRFLFEENAAHAPTTKTDRQGQANLVQRPQ
jgi:hypothetical protein